MKALQLSMAMALFALIVPFEASRATLRLSVEDVKTGANSNVSIGVFAEFTVTDNEISGFNLPFEVGGNAAGLPSGLSFDPQSFQSFIFPNLAVNTSQNEIWGLDGIANGDGPNVVFAVGERRKLFDFVVEVAETAPGDTFVPIEIANMFLLSVATAEPAEVELISGGIRITNPHTLDGDCNGDSVIDAKDLECGCEAGLSAVLNALNVPLADLNADGEVGFADFLVLSANFGMQGGYGDGDITCDGEVAFADFLILSANFGQSSTASGSKTVPEPASDEPILILLIGLSALRLIRQRAS